MKKSLVILAALLAASSAPTFASVPSGQSSASEQSEQTAQKRRGHVSCQRINGVKVCKSTG